VHRLYPHFASEAMRKINGYSSLSATIGSTRVARTAGMSEPASVSGAALPDGVVLAGWRTGARVHVEFHTTTSCLDAPDARTCFQGTIHIERAPEE